MCEIILAAGICPRFVLNVPPQSREGAGESRMPVASNGLVRELIEKHTSFSHHRS